MNSTRMCWPFLMCSMFALQEHSTWSKWLSKTPVKYFIVDNFLFHLVFNSQIFFCFFLCCRRAKARNRMSFRQILMHLEIASPELLNFNREDFKEAQVNTISPSTSSSCFVLFVLFFFIFLFLPALSFLCLK